MADTSFSFDPDSIASTSDAASKASDVASKASDTASKASDAVTKLKRTVILKVFAETSDVAAGSGAMFFAVPDILSGTNLVSCGAHVYASVASDKLQVQLHNVDSAVDMISAAKLLEIDTGEFDTVTASSAAVIDTAADGVATGEAIRVDVDAAASGAKGLEVRLTFQKP